MHIPYCRKACIYCNFHFSTHLEHRDDYLASVLKEISLRRDYLHQESVDSVYFGGGTPSLFSPEQIQKICDQIAHFFHWSTNVEVTLEANPEDLTVSFLNRLRQTPVNRLSIGVQSFEDTHLRWMNRSHTAAQAEHAIQRAQDAGFDNLNLDLIFGFRGLDNEQWIEHLAKVKDLGVAHLSCYGLTVEPRTALAHQIARQIMPPPDEETAAQQLLLFIDWTENNGWLHYEISNAAVSEKTICRHNLAYWKGNTYLGIGAGAHSFDGTTRQWNIASNPLYIESLRRGTVPFERETLTARQRINERILTELRTCWGLDLRTFDEEVVRHLHHASAPWLKKGCLCLRDQHLKLTKQGKLVADRIALDLMLEPD